MKKLLVVLSIFFSLGIFAECPIFLEQANYCAKLEWIDGPQLDVKSHFQVTFWNAADETETPINPEQAVKIYSWMYMNNGHNHGGPAMTVQNPREGLFEVEDARFFMHGMKGYWVVRIDLLEGRNLISRGSERVSFE